MSTSAAASRPSWTIPETTTAPFCAELGSLHLLFGTNTSLLDCGLCPFYHQHGRAPDLSSAQRLQGLVRLFEGKRAHLRADGHLRGEGEELLAVLAGKVRDRADGALSPEDLVREGGYVAHVDAGAHHHPSLRDGPQRDRHQRPDGSEDDRRVELLRRGLTRASGPGGAQLAREALALLVTIPAEREDLPALMNGHLDDYVGGVAEAVEAEAFGVADHGQRAVADQTRAQERCGLEVQVPLGNREAEAVVGDGVPGVAAVYLVAGEPGVIAEVLPAREAVAAGAVRVAEPGDADPVPRREAPDACADPLHRADDLVAGDQGQLRVGELAVHHVQVRPAHRAGVDPDHDPLGPRFRLRHPGGAQGAARRVEDHRAHRLPTLQPREDVQRPSADDLLKATILSRLDTALLAQGGQGGEARRAGLQDPRALGDLQPRHVVRELALAPGALVRLPEVPANNAAVLSTRAAHEPSPHRVPRGKFTPGR